MLTAFVTLWIISALLVVLGIYQSFQPYGRFPTLGWKDIDMLDILNVITPIINTGVVIGHIYFGDIKPSKLFKSNDRKT